MVFRNLRERFCIDDQDYQVDVNPLMDMTFALLLLTESACVCAELSDEERSAQQRLPGSLR